MCAPHVHIWMKHNDSIDIDLERKMNPFSNLHANVSYFSIFFFWILMQCASRQTCNIHRYQFSFPRSQTSKYTNQKSLFENKMHQSMHFVFLLFLQANAARYFRSYIVCLLIYVYSFNRSLAHTHTHTQTIGYFIVQIDSPSPIITSNLTQLCSGL